MRTRIPVLVVVLACGLVAGCELNKVVGFEAQPDGSATVNLDTGREGNPGVTGQILIPPSGNVDSATSVWVPLAAAAATFLVGNRTKPIRWGKGFE